MLQALYFCRPFRENVLAYKAQQKKKENLLTCLADLFHSIATQKKKVGVIPPKKFISRLRKENGEIDYTKPKYNHCLLWTDWERAEPRDKSTRGLWCYTIIATMLYSLNLPYDWCW